MFRLPGQVSFLLYSASQVLLSGSTLTISINSNHNNTFLHYLELTTKNKICQTNFMIYGAIREEFLCWEGTLYLH